MLCEFYTIGLLLKPLHLCLKILYGYGVLRACMSEHHMHTWYLGGQKKVPGALGQEL